MRAFSYFSLCVFAVTLTSGANQPSSEKLSIGQPWIPLRHETDTNSSTNQSSKVLSPNLEILRLKRLQRYAKFHEHRVLSEIQRQNNSAPDFSEDARNLNIPESPRINDSEVIDHCSGRVTPESEPFPEFYNPRSVRSVRRISKRERYEYWKWKIRHELKSSLTEVSGIGPCCRLCLLLLLVLMLLAIFFGGMGKLGIIV